MTKPLTPEVRERVVARARKAVSAYFLRRHGPSVPEYFNHLNTALSSSMHGDD